MVCSGRAWRGAASAGTYTRRGLYSVGGYDFGNNSLPSTVLSGDEDAVALQDQRRVLVGDPDRDPAAGLVTLVEGALLGPVIDRLLVVSGMLVCWDFSLLPRWAIALVVAREVFMLALSRYALSRGVEITINWAGRIGVAPTMAAPFLAIAGVHWLALVMLYVGLALSLTASALYVRRGLQEVRARTVGLQ